MRQQKWHGILVDQAFGDRSFAEKYCLFAKEKTITLGWVIYGIEVEQLSNQMLTEMQSAMRSDNHYYIHFYNDDEIVVVFKETVFRVGSHHSTWNSVIEFGRKNSIPEDQLDFWPNRFQDERHYFKAESFLRTASR